ncbi:MAG TPA: hypothetical protein DIT26_01845 [Mesotoga infera]|jgi:predicted AlkP superfamily pyrophosphatase or phosphodiesterase|uniref:Alkaline phosphatase family protein n=1 Tax=Mesotoga infera TaxID=1236046 RepID=A0A3D3TLU0_9BACT|nr:MAG: putative AP superfamily protein [Marinimicrobia bacterium 46_43]HCO69322.1 hypothetical protein [Mesotoga infera]
MRNIPLLFVTIDSLGPEVLMKARTPFLDSIAETGCMVKEMRSCFPTLTTPMMSTILTGVYPEKHGIFSNTVLNRKEMKVEGRLRDLKRQPITDCLYENNYCVLSIQHFMLQGRKGVKHVQVDGNRSSAIRKALLKELEKKKFDAIFCLYQSLDSVGHKYGPLHRKTIRELEEIDSELKLVSDFLEETIGEFVIIISSDHSMSLADSPTDFDLAEVIKSIGLKAELGKEGKSISKETDILMLKYPTVNIYTLTEEAREKKTLLVDTLRKISVIDRIYTEEEMKKLHNREYADIAFCLKRGYSNSLKSKILGSLFGYHGTYHEEPSVFMFRDIHKTKNCIEKGTLVDIAPTTLDLLDIESSVDFDGISLKK